MRKIPAMAFAALLALILSGCATQAPSPYDVGGRYYMVGDSACASFKRVKNSRMIQCYDAKGHPTQRRRAMTTQELMMYTHQQQMAQMRSIESEMMFSRMTYSPRWW